MYHIIYNGDIIYVPMSHIPKGEMFMKNKGILIILIFIMTCCWFLNHSYASNTATVYLSNSKDIVEKGEEIEIMVNIESRKTAAFHLSLYFDSSKLEYVSEIENVNRMDNRLIFVWYDTQGGKGAKEGELVKFKFKAKENGLATFTIQGEFYNEKAQLIQTDFKEKQVQIGKEESILQKQVEDEKGNNLQSSNATLQALRLDREGLTPNFDKDVREYYLTLSNDVQEVEVLAITENPKATVEIRGNTDLKEGLNDITIHVISEDKVQNNNYMIHVTKTANLELANTNLEMLAIENVLLEPPFAISETNYKAVVSHDTESIHLLAVPENEQASVQVTGKENLKEGHNLVSILVTAPNGFTKKNYQIDVYRRNLQEEEMYQEQQEENRDKLEEAYQIQELSGNIDEVQEQATEGQSKKYENIAVWVVVASVMAFVILWGIWKKRIS